MRVRFLVTGLLATVFAASVSTAAVAPDGNAARIAVADAQRRTSS